MQALNEKLTQLQDDKQTYLDWLDVCDISERDQVIEIIDRIEADIQETLDRMNAPLMTVLYWTKKGECRFVKLPSVTTSPEQEKKTLVLSFMSNANLEYFFAQRYEGILKEAHLANYQKYKSLAQQVRNAL